MQDTIIMAFRKRLKSRGYCNISIRIARDEKGFRIHDLYLVKAIEPLACADVSALYSKTQMYHSFR